ncbi:nucleotide-diphospho-sugar transferase [Mucilaginibacter xinganensis]|uniref:Nucleotide-diphospho-sugar transferase n=1 Tax=Mucilaginibacter xinganensis TaxID=1234841 RepID=A0A223P200_9SPHI|nr:nucleotide-diphospho-sugar transferase [Mucilaginibacter xinganensis]ASU36142.1 nucleotide-diphospho-sugar transferase [Mucilaginibacter xinganensis]
MGQFDTFPYQTNSAVLFVIFNRPDTTKLVFDQIRAARPKRLYIAADGPRSDNPNDGLLCKKARDIVKNVDWDCEVQTRYSETNIGCKKGVSAAVTWFFNNEEEGIILEDDCLPANSFFKFCDTLLNKYRNDTRVRHITGCNLQQGKKWGDASYYFSNRTHVWGWASWRRVWNDYDLNLEKYDQSEITELFQNIYEDPLVAESWAQIFEDVKADKINSWAYPLDFANFFNNGLVIIPNQNLISNIGFSAGATNTTEEGNIYANLPLSEIDEIIDPVLMLPEKRADLCIINRDFNIDQRRRKQNSVNRKVKKWLGAVFRNAAL